MKQLDILKTDELVELFNKQNMEAYQIYNSQQAKITKLCDLAYKSVKNGFRVIYVGAGTSGRIGLLDALDVLPTFGEANWFTYSMAGGSEAILASLEGYEDDAELGVNDAKNLDVKAGDLVVGLSASGNTKYVYGFMQHAESVGAKIALVTNKQGGRCEELSDLVVDLVVQNEIVQGSTRLLGGTLQKMVANTISTVVAIKMGKVFDEWMINLTPINEKLVARSIDIIARIVNCATEVAAKAYKEAHDNIKVAIIMLVKKVNANEAKSILEKNHNNLRKAMS
ncbi:N-acetylmuramic acid 6-phosphate etherase [Mycoplasma corogypsi]|uniref:N-acetylmuramic acid 6-phosphate etherase n=1 Tax=Mycoplasma corogypsi TaxID=2106 RepID=UPI003872C614